MTDEPALTRADADFRRTSDQLCEALRDVLNDARKTGAARRRCTRTRSPRRWSMCWCPPSSAIRRASILARRARWGAAAPADHRRHREGCEALTPTAQRVAARSRGASESLQIPGRETTGQSSCWRVPRSRSRRGSSGILSSPTNAPTRSGRYELSVLTLSIFSRDFV